MFDKEKRYMSIGVKNEIPDYLVSVMFSLIDNLCIKADYLQVFDLSVIKTHDGEIIQKIRHSQEVPEYSSELFIPIRDNSDAVDTKIFVIDDGVHNTMILSHEY